MPAATRLGDLCTGHGCWGPRPNAEASEDVFYNSIFAHRLGDAWAVHCCPAIPECHGGNTASGSSTVFVNNKAAARIGDSVNCGSSIAEGSPNVFIGG